MGDGFQYFDIILFAMVAAFLVLRLRSVLGRRTGTEQQRDPLARRLAAKRDPKAPGNNAPAANPADNVVSLADRNRLAEDALAASAQGAPLPLAAALAAIHKADPSFDTTGFLGGARGAFELIVHAFASGDTATLRPLLSDDVYDHFAEAIRHRIEAHETHETNLVTIRAADFVEAQLSGRTAFVTVKFVSDQINVTRGGDNQVIDGDPEHAVEKSDFWTFARNTRSQDPNWLLVATRST